ncbi:hypothetical protein ACJ41O_011091 [Fusarium nematophilum]
MLQRILAHLHLAHLWLLITTATSITLVVSSYLNVHLPPRLNAAIISDRASVQVIIQAATFILALLQITVIRGFLERWILHRLREQALTLDCLTFWAAISKGVLDKNGPRLYLALSLLWIPLLNSLQVWWTGALTPEVHLREVKETIQIPYYNQDTEGQYWNRTMWSAKLPIARHAQGSFSYSPIYTILGSILDSAAVATAAENATQVVPKLDNTGYRYLNRSHGVGASVGFDRRIEGQSQGGLETYHFVEPGYYADISCSHDPAMKASVKEVSSSGEGSWYRVLQSLPHGAEENIVLPGRVGDSSEIVALLGNPHDGRYGWGIVVGESAKAYEALNMTFCEVSFQRRDFRVEVLPGQGLINVTAINGLMEDGTVLGNDWSKMPTNVVHQIGMIVQTSGSALFSPLGNALVSNIAQAEQARRNKLLPDSLDEADISLYGITRALETMVDHILVGFAGAQFMIPPGEMGQKSTTMTASYQVFEIGNERFIWAVFATNCLILALLLAEPFVMARSSSRRGCEGVEFDWCEPKELILRTSFFGDMNHRFLDQRPSRITADLDLKEAGSIAIRLKDGDYGHEGVVLTDACGDAEDQVELLRTEEPRPVSAGYKFGVAQVDERAVRP